MFGNLVLGSLLAFFMNIWVKFDLLILVEFWTSSIVQENKIKEPQMKDIHTLDRANNSLLKQEGLNQI